MDLGRLTIRDRQFGVTSAELMGYLTRDGADWFCLWHVDIKTEARSFPDEPIDWAPYAYAHHLRTDLRSWRAWDGVTVEGEDEQGNAPSVVRSETTYRLYVYEHAPISQNRITFTGRRGCDFNVRWTGLAAIYAGEEYDVLVPFEVTTVVRFTRIGLSLSLPPGTVISVPDARSLLGRVFDPAEFEEQNVEYVDKGRMFSVDFVPT